MSYSYDLRKRVETYVLEGGKKTAAARLFRVHVQTIHNWMRMKGSVGSADKPGPKTGRAVKRAALTQAIAAHPDARLKELAKDFQVHPSTIFYACKKWGITRKKNLGRQGARSDETESLFTASRALSMAEKGLCLC